MNKLLNLSIIAFLASIQCIYAQSDTIRQITLDEVTVSAFRIETNPENLPHGITVLAREEIEATPNQSVGDLLKKKAFVDIVEYPGFVSSVGMRGFRPTSQSYVLLLVNGIPAGTQNVSTLDLSNASKVEVLKGPFSSFFGSGAMGGVVNIVGLGSKGDFGGNLDLALGSFGTYGVNGSFGGALSNKVNFDLGVKLHTQDKDYKTGSNNILGLSTYQSEVLDQNSLGMLFKNTTYTKYNVNGRLGIDINDKWSIDIHQSYFLADKIKDNGSFWGVYDPFEKDVFRWSQSLNLQGRVGSHSLRFSPFFSNENSRFHVVSQTTSYIQSTDNFKNYGFVLQDAISIGSHQLLFGVDNNSARFENRNNSSPSESSAPWQPDHLTSSTGAFLQARFNMLRNKLKTTFGARFEIISFRVFDTPHLASEADNETHKVFNPNLGFAFQITPELSVRSNAGTAFLAPDAFKKAGLYQGWSTTMGNPDLKPEKSLTVDLGLNFSSKSKGLDFAITYFDTKHDDLITTSYVDWSLTTFINAGKARMNGLEMEMGVDVGKLARKSFSLSFSGNWRHLFKFELDSDGVASDLKYVQKNTASLAVEFNDRKRFSARLNARIIGSRLEDNWFYTYNLETWERIPLTSTAGNLIRPTLINEDVLEYPSFVVVDLSASYSLGKNASLGVVIQNLLDEHYTEKDGYFMPGRGFTLKAGYKF